ncbi:MAG: Fe-S cluster assembly ATPase SufC [Puniceicoccales bacterium]|nr:Fe-S cluster assembly ATPase SufC [Puniceicoccales bacterium]
MAEFTLNLRSMCKEESQRNFAPYVRQMNPIIKSNTTQNNAIGEMFKKSHRFSSMKIAHFFCYIIKMVVFVFLIINNLRKSMCALEIKNLRLSVNDNVVLDGFSLKILPGEIHAFIGKNGVGKSSLAKAIAGHPAYKIQRGDVVLDGESIMGKAPDEIARQGFFLAFQSPIELPGISLANFIRAAVQSRLPKGTPLSGVDFYKSLYAQMEVLQIDKSFTSRPLNDGFSGGEKKRCEVLQMMMVKPKYAILDETDSGLDIDALKIVANAVNAMRNDNFAAIIITHHNKLLEYIRPDVVHIISGGKIAMSGGLELIDRLEKFGYGFINDENLL